MLFFTNIIICLFVVVVLFVYLFVHSFASFFLLHDCLFLYTYICTIHVFRKIFSHEKHEERYKLFNFVWEYFRSREPEGMKKALFWLQVSRRYIS